jgi:hypothetical protein
MKGFPAWLDLRFLGAEVLLLLSYRLDPIRFEHRAMCRLAMNRIHQQFSRNTLWLEFATEFPSQMREKSG